jgi:hypothetical protein
MSDYQLIRRLSRRAGEPAGALVPPELQTEYPHIEVDLTQATSGDSIALVVHTARAMHFTGVSTKDIERFKREALSADYDHVISTIMRTVTVI